MLSVKNPLALHPGRVAGAQGGDFTGWWWDP